MVGASLILLHFFISAFCVYLLVNAVEKETGRFTYFDAIMTILLSVIPLGNIGVITFCLIFRE